MPGARYDPTHRFALEVAFLFELGSMSATKINALRNPDVSQ
jgi:hypothetical protein